MMRKNYNLTKEKNQMMKDLKKLGLMLLFILINLTNGFGQIPTPGEKQSQATLIVGAVLHIGDGSKIIDGAVGFIDGKISFVGSDQQVDRSKYEVIVEAENQHIYPSFIAVNSKLGLKEIDAVRASRDFREVGSYNPHVRSAVAYNAESMITPTVRSNGVLMGQITPKGGVISGKSSIMQFDAWDWEDAVVKEDDGFHLNWPRTRKWDFKTRSIVIDEEYQKKVDRVEEFFKKAQAYAKIGYHTDINLRYEALTPLFGSQKAIYIHASNVRQILDAVQFSKKFGFKNMVIVGGYDAWRISDVLKDNNIPVMLNRVHSLPERDDEDVDLPYKSAKKMQDAGILFCLDSDGSMAEMNTRNLPFYAGTCVAYGLSEEEAIAAVSLNTAKILGIDAQYGSLTVGKVASLFVSEGDALDMRTNKLTKAYIAGREVDLKNSQELLYEKFQLRKEESN